MRFESYVILDTTKTDAKDEIEATKFESYVILETTKTCNNQSYQQPMFESYVNVNCYNNKIGNNC